MIEEVYEHVLKKREEIIDKILSKKYADISQKWVDYTPQPKAKPIIGIDGGMFTKDFREGIFFYVVDAEAVLYDGKEEKVIGRKAVADVFVPGNYGKERVGELMAIYELELALENLGKADFILLDGSLAKKAEGKKPNVIMKETLEDILKTDDEELMLKKLIHYKLMLIAKLLHSGGNKVLFISKANKSRNIFNNEYSDLAVIESLTHTPGYTKPIQLEINVEKEELIKYNSFIVRLQPLAPALRIDAPFNTTEEDVREIMNVLADSAINGYPHPLLQAHIDVRASYKDRKAITSLIKPSGKPSWYPQQLS